MPHYRTTGKLIEPISDKGFISSMKDGHFCRRKHMGFVTLLYYSAVRKTEALRATKEQFRLTKDRIFFNVGKRLKRGIDTKLPLNIPLSAPFADEIVYSIEHTEKNSRVWPYCKKTGYNIVHRVYAYPHFFRLSRITNFFLEGWSIAQVRSWSGLTLRALEFYVGLVDIMKMGESLGKKKRRRK